MRNYFGRAFVNKIVGRSLGFKPCSNGNFSRTSLLLAILVLFLFLFAPVVEADDYWWLNDGQWLSEINVVPGTCQQPTSMSGYILQWWPKPNNSVTSRKSGLRFRSEACFLIRLDLTVTARLSLTQNGHIC